MQMSTRVIQCRQCGRLFQSLGNNICPGCVEELDKSFEMVKNYIYDNPDANVLEISKATGVPEKQVLEFLREGRLFINNPEEVIQCERCGKPLNGGRYCAACQAALENALGSVAPSPSASKDQAEYTGSGYGKMHFNYRGRKKF